jgi:hypothetical protein
MTTGLESLMKMCLFLAVALFAGCGLDPALELLFCETCISAGALVPGASAGGAGGSGGDGGKAATSSSSAGGGSVGDGGATGSGGSGGEAGATASSGGGQGGQGGAGGSGGSGGSGGENCTPVADPCNSQSCGVVPNCGVSRDCGSCTPEVYSTYITCNTFWHMCECTRAFNNPEAWAACASFPSTVPYYCGSLLGYHGPPECVTTGSPVSNGEVIACCPP